jgi:hypothetical protein
MKKFLNSILVVLLLATAGFGQLNNVKSMVDLASDRSNLASATRLDSAFFQNLTRALENRDMNDQDFASLSAALTAASDSSRLLTISGTHSITSNTTMSGGYSVKATPSASFSITAGDTLFVQVPFYADRHQVFSGAGAVRFTQGTVSEVYPEWFGAARDGATDDAQEIQKAMDSIEKGKISFASGTYLVNQQIDLADTQGGVLIKGDGFGSVLKIANSSTIAAIFLIEKDRVTVDGLTFDVNHANSSTGTRKALKIQNCDNIRVMNCDFIGGEDLLVASTEFVSTASVNDFMFINNMSVNNENVWLAMGGTDNFVVTGNIFRGDGTNDTGTPFNATGNCDNGVIANNIIQYSGGAGVFLDDPGSTGDWPTNIVVNTNVIHGTYGDCILAEQGLRIGVSGNVIAEDHPVLGGDTGVSIGGQFNSAVGNIIYDKNNVGISMFYKGPGTAPPGQYPYYKLAVANIISDTGMDNFGSAARTGIWNQNIERSLIGSNLITNTLSPSGLQQYGIYATGTADYNQYVGNYIMRDSVNTILFANSNNVDVANLRMQTLGTIDSVAISAPAGELHIDEFVQTGDIDANGNGGHKYTYWFWAQNVPANTTTALSPFGSPTGHNHFQLIGSGSVIGVTYRTNAALTAGTAEIDIKVENVDTGFGLSLTSSSAIAVSATQDKDTDTFSNTQRLQVEIVTDSSFLPSGSMDIIVGVLIER